ncbi:S-layer homology domain-containing protein [Candidatus Pacearchaeota archaeon]|nr:S-layer homology domain-containing protein [Candidatus Pacearchaeota archaeon]
MNKLGKTALAIGLTGLLALVVPTGLRGEEAKNEAGNQTKPAATATTQTKVQTFQDVPTNYWAYDAIEKVYNEKIMNGCAEDPKMFCPAGRVTRRSLMKYIERLFGYDEKFEEFYPPVNPTFSDISQDDEEFYKAVEYLIYLDDFFAEYEQNEKQFMPDKEATRLDISLFLVDILNLKPFYPDAPSFEDISVTNKYYGNIEAIAKKGIVNGIIKDDKKYFMPDRTITRDETATFIYRAFFKK